MTRTTSTTRTKVLDAIRSRAGQRSALARNARQAQCISVTLNKRAAELVQELQDHLSGVRPLKCDADVRDIARTLEVCCTPEQLAVLNNTPLMALRIQVER